MREPVDLFTAGEVQLLVGISQRQLTYWDESRLVQPHGREADGRGSRRLYTLLDVLQLKLIRRLLNAGVSLQKIRVVLECLADLPDEPAPLLELEILTDGKRIIVRRTDEQFLDPLKGQFVWRFSLSDLLTEMQTAAPSTAGLDTPEPRESRTQRV